MHTSLSNFLIKYDLNRQFKEKFFPLWLERRLPGEFPRISLLGRSLIRVYWKTQYTQLTLMISSVFQEASFPYIDRKIRISFIIISRFLYFLFKIVQKGNLRSPFVMSLMAFHGNDLPLFSPLILTMVFLCSIRSWEKFLGTNISIFVLGGSFVLVDFAYVLGPPEKEKKRSLMSYKMKVIVVKDRLKKKNKWYLR